VKCKISDIRPSDWVVVVYSLIVAVLILVARERVPNWGLFLLGHLACIGMVFLLAAWEPRTTQKWVRYLRDFDALFYIIGLFMMTTLLVHRVHPIDYDPQLISIDRSIGGIAILKWMESISHPVLTDISKVTWILYYPLPLLVGIPLYRRRDRSLFYELKLLYVLTWLVSYLGYFALPAEGPGYHQEAIGVAQPKWEETVVSASIKEGIDVMEGEARDTFPSGHVMIAAMTIMACFRYRLRKVAWIAVPFSLAVMWSTLYLRYHYLIDGLVGIGLVLLITWLGGLWFRRSREPVGVVVPEPTR